MENIVISVIAKAAEYLVDPTIHQGQYLFCIKKFMKNLEKTKDELTSKRDIIQYRTEQAEKRTEIIEKHVQKWLNDVKNLLDEAEKLKQEAEVNNNCFHGCCPSRKRYCLCKQIAKKTEKMTELIKKNEFEPFSHLASLPSIEYESSGNFSHFKSTTVAYNQLMEALQDDSTHIIGLYGMGGAGKTSLAIEVGKKTKELNLFDLVMKVTMSQTPNIGKIQEEMADFLNLKFTDYSEEGRKRRLSLRLRQEKRVVIIVDDVWGEFDLKDIGIDFYPSQKGSCKVLLTTRRLQVCTLMGCQRKIMLELLSEEEAWTLFRKYASIDDQYSYNILNMAWEVARECKGLPIAIKAVASSLKGKFREFEVDEWKVALKKLKDSKPLDEEGEKAFSCLKLSYDYLKNKEAQLLFLMCAMFPEDHEIPVEELIRYGAGLGVCGEFESFDLARSQVKVGLNKLLDSCLLMPSEKKRDDHMKMHDLVRDTALWISPGEDRIIMVNIEKDVNSLVGNGVTKNCFAVSSWHQNTHEISYQWNAPKLEILILNTECLRGLSLASFDGMKGLKVMAITNESFYEKSLLLPQSIQSLNNLRTLRLRGWILGDISLIVSLRKLEVLDLQYCCFKEMPEGIENLNKLKLLDLSNSFVMENYNSKAIARCPQLQELYVSGFGDSVNLYPPQCFVHDLGDRVNIYPPQCFVHDLASTNLQRYELLLGKLSNKFGEKDVSSTRILQIKDFDISTIVGSRNHLLQKAEEVEFVYLSGGCNNVIPDMLKAVGCMNDLRKLRLSKCEQIECLTDADSFQEDALMPRLVNLELDDLHNLKELCRGRPVLGFFEKLEQVSISFCSNFRNVFPKEAKLCNLRILYLYRCEVVTLFSMFVAASLQRMEDLTVASCSMLRHIITSEGGEISLALNNSHSIFPNLKKLRVSDCRKLQFVFPISCGHQGLGHLQEIDISSCYELKYVFGPYDNEHNNSSHDQNEIQIMLPSLQVFQLFSLQNLIGICPQNCHASWPSLRELSWNFCPRLATWWICSQQHTNVGVDPADDHTKHLVFKLESLRLLDLFELSFIWSGPQIPSFQYLRSLKMSFCSRQKYIFPTAIHINLPELTSLEIEGCDELEEVIAKNEEEPQNHSNAQVCLPKLNNLRIVKCDKLKILFTVAMIRTLPQLDTLHIERCAHLKEIFRRTANEEDIVLTNLRRIYLFMLPSLSQGFTLHKLMQLEDVTIQGCPNFSPRATQVIPLHQITEEGLILWEINTSSNQLSQQQLLPVALQSFLNIRSINLDDNCRVEGILKIEVEGVLHVAQNSLHSNLMSLFLYDLPELRFIWSDPVSFLGFHELKDVHLRGCAKLKTIFPPGIVGSLQNLRSLIISYCEELEDIIIMSSDLKVVCFPNLLELTVRKCDKLKRLFSASLGCDFPKLCLLDIEECTKLKCPFSGSVICNLPELSYIYIKKCSELEKVFHFKPTEADDGKDHGELQLVLPKLRGLTLESLPNFTEIEKLKMQVQS